MINAPACYYGDREGDIAMTGFFGGFPEEFNQAYNKEWQLEKGYEERKMLYILNHVNLFDGAYLPQAQNMMRQILA